MLVVLALILTAVFLFCGRSILLLFGASENTIGSCLGLHEDICAGNHFRTAGAGAECIYHCPGLRQDQHVYTVLIGAVCNIILDPIFIFGLNMGVKGAALATILSQAVSSVWVLRFLTSEKSSLRIKKEEPENWRQALFFPVWHWEHRRLSWRLRKVSCPSASIHPCFATAETWR